MNSRCLPLREQLVLAKMSCRFRGLSMVNMISNTLMFSVSGSQLRARTDRRIWSALMSSLPVNASPKVTDSSWLAVSSMNCLWSVSWMCFCWISFFEALLVLVCADEVKALGYDGGRWADGWQYRYVFMPIRSLRLAFGSFEVNGKFTLGSFAQVDMFLGPWPNMISNILMFGTSFPLGVVVILTLSEIEEVAKGEMLDLS